MILNLIKFKGRQTRKAAAGSTAARARVCVSKECGSEECRDQKKKKKKREKKKKEKRKKERPGGQRVSELVAAEAKLPAGDDDHDFNVDHVYLQDKIVPSIMASVACS